MFLPLPHRLPASICASAPTRRICVAKTRSWAKQRPQATMSRRSIERRHRVRSEEHTSELQSLMRISYAVFCLKKKNKNQTHTYTKATEQYKMQQYENMTTR